MSAQSPSEVASQAVRSYLAGVFEPGSLPPPLAQVLTSRTLSLLQLIKILGEVLTSEDERERSKGVELLAQVVIDLAPAPETGVAAPASHPFDRQVVRTLAAFFAEKLNDGSVVAESIARSSNSAEKVVPGSAPSYRFKTIPEGTEMLACSLRALHRLALLDGFGSEQTRNTATALTTHVRPRDHPQSVRFLVYVLLDALLARHRTALKSMGKPFLKGYVDLAEGEKDPRNLMYLFAMDRVILIEWELDPEMAEALYDITYCYFPITFRPPPGDPYGITTEDLKRALKSCMTANPLLAPHAMPLLLEKLGASGGSTKRDTLETLEEAMPIFGKAAVLANHKKLWEGFKVEIMAATDEETSLYAQRALASFLRTLYHDEKTPEGIAPRVIADALSELEQPEKSLAKPASELLVAMVKACPSTAHLAVYALLDQMLGMFKDPAVTNVRGPILGHIATILQALREVYNGEPSQQISDEKTTFTFAAPASSTAAAEPVADPLVEGTSSARPAKPGVGEARTYDGDGRPLDPMRDELLSALSNGVRSTQYRASALLAFVHLTHIPTFLSAAETNYIAESVNDLILSPGAEDVRSAALDGLRDIARVNPRVLEETTLPLLFSRLPDRMSAPSVPPSERDIEQRGVVRRVLGALARLCAQPDLFDMLVVRLFTKLDLTCAGQCASKEESEANIGYARGLMVTILTVLEEKARKKHTDIPKYGVTLCPRIFALVLSAALHAPLPATQPPIATDVQLLRDAGRLVTLLVRNLIDDRQIDLAQWLHAAFLQGDIASITRKEGNESLFQPFSSTASVQQRNAVYVYAAALVALQKEVTNVQDQMELGAWVRTLLNFVVESSTAAQAEAGYSLLASTLNKRLAEPLPAEVSVLLEDFWREEVSISHSSTVGGNRRQVRAIRAWFWMAKALLVRNSKSGQGMVDQACETLFHSENRSAGKEAARALGLVAKADDGILTKENGAVVRLLYRQKFFTVLLPKIVNGYAGGSGPSSSVYLIALASVLPWMPRPMVQERLPQIFPLLIRALDLEDPSARASAANTITLAAAVGKKERDEEIRAGGEEPNGLAKQRGSTSLDLVQDHAHTLVERLMSLAKPSESSTPEVRIASLRCLATIVRCVPFSALRNEQVRVLKALHGPGLGVDDPRREVRSVAVDCKAAWHVAT
ncbi:unnamed protein product [Jaminaea pallidilutea]